MNKFYSILKIRLSLPLTLLVVLSASESKAQVAVSLDGYLGGLNEFAIGSVVEGDERRLQIVGTYPFSGKTLAIDFDLSGSPANEEPRPLTVPWIGDRKPFDTFRDIAIASDHSGDVVLLSAGWEPHQYAISTFNKAGELVGVLARSTLSFEHHGLDHFGSNAIIAPRSVSLAHDGRIAIAGSIGAYKRGFIEIIAPSGYSMIRGFFRAQTSFGPQFVDVRAQIGASEAGWFLSSSSYIPGNVYAGYDATWSSTGWIQAKEINLIHENDTVVGQVDIVRGDYKLPIAIHEGYPIFERGTVTNVSVDYEDRDAIMIRAEKFNSNGESIGNKLALAVKQFHGENAGATIRSACFDATEDLWIVVSVGKKLYLVNVNSFAGDF